MPFAKPQNVAIIGAGPAGLLLSICLASRGIHSTVYEAHGPKLDVGAGVVLSANGLRLLDEIGVYSSLVPKGREWEATCIVDEQGHIFERFYYGHQTIYGYKALRISRRDLVGELTIAVQSSGMEIKYHSRFEGVISDSEGGVSFTINQQVMHADMLIGADGIHSSIRSLIDSKPLSYDGLLGVGGVLLNDHVQWPSPDFPPTAIIRGKPGSMITFAEDAKRTTAVTGIPFPERSQAAWTALNADKAELMRLLRAHYDEWGAVNRSIIDALTRNSEDVFIWPFYTVPQLSHWATRTRRIVLVGDSAHAIPPSSGQGVSQAVEDVYSLARLLDSLPATGNSLAKTIDFWQQWRQERVRQITRMVHIMNVKRMPEAQRLQHADVQAEDLESVQGGEGMYTWLFNTDFDKELGTWETEMQDSSN